MQSLLEAGAQTLQDIKDVGGGRLIASVNGGGRLIASVKDTDGNIIGLLQSTWQADCNKHCFSFKSQEKIEPSKRFRRASGRITLARLIRAQVR